MRRYLLLLLLVLGSCGIDSAREVYKQPKWKNYHYIGSWLLKDEPSYVKERPGVIIYRDVVNGVEYITIMDDEEAIMLERR